MHIAPGRFCCAKDPIQPGRRKESTNGRESHWEVASHRHRARGVFQYEQSHTGCLGNTDRSRCRSQSKNLMDERQRD